MTSLRCAASPSMTAAPGWSSRSVISWAWAPSRCGRFARARQRGCPCLRRPSFSSAVTRTRDRRPSTWKTAGTSTNDGWPTSWRRRSDASATPWVPRSRTCCDTTSGTCRAAFNRVAGRSDEEDGLLDAQVMVLEILRGRRSLRNPRELCVPSRLACKGQRCLQPGLPFFRGGTPERVPRRRPRSGLRPGVLRAVTWILSAGAG